MFFFILHLAVLSFIRIERFSALTLRGDENITQIYSSSARINSISLDEYICGNFLLGRYNDIVTTDFSTQQTLYKDSTASKGLTHLSNYQLIFSPFNKACIMSLDRRTDELSTFAGTCGEQGSVLGHRLQSAKFKTVVDIKRIHSSTLLILDDERLLFLDLITDMITDAVPSVVFSRRPFSLALHPADPNIVYISEGANILEVHLDTGSQTLFAGGFANAYGAVFFNSRDADQALVIDYNAGLKLIDKKRNHVNLLCSNGLTTSPLGAATCKIPRGIVGMVVGDRFYIGHTTGVNMIQTQSSSSTRLEDETGILFVRKPCSSFECGYSDETPSVPISRCSMLCLRDSSCRGFGHHDGKCRIMTSKLATVQDFGGTTCFVPAH